MTADNSPTTSTPPPPRGTAPRSTLAVLLLALAALAYLAGANLGGTLARAVGSALAATAGAAGLLLGAGRFAARPARQQALQDLVQLTEPLVHTATGTTPRSTPRSTDDRHQGGHGAAATPETETDMTATTDNTGTPAQTAAAAAPAAASTSASAASAPQSEYVAEPGTGFVYVMSNQETGNSVRVFNRADDGSITLAGTYPTGGLGGGTSTDLNLALDPLVAQGALEISDDGRFLFAVNAGSDELSVLAIKGDTLVAVDRVPSGGVRPMSVTTHKNLVYVVNSTSGTIAGYTVGSHGKLTEVDGSAHTLIGGANAGPSQIKFSPDGTKLVVTERQNTVIDVFPVDEYGRAGAPVKNVSSGIGPFGVTFHTNEILLVTEVTNAVSSYRVGPDCTLTPITGSLPTTELATCWSVNSILDPTIAYIANAQSGSISGLRFDENGAITLLTADGHLQVMRQSHAPQDIGLSRDGRYLYVLTDGYDEKLTDPRLPTFVDGASYAEKMSISAFRVEPRGGLTPIGGYGVGADHLDVNLEFGTITGYIPGLEPGHEGLVVT